MLIAKQVKRRENLLKIELMKKRSNVHKQRALLQIINLPVTWLIDYLSLSTVLLTTKIKEY